MCPEYLTSNMWRLLPGEFIIDDYDQRLDGPLLVRVNYHPEWGLMAIQGEGTNLECSADSDDLSAVVRRTKE